MNGGERIAAVLKEQGVGALFTLCGGHISPILAGAKAVGIRVIDVRDELIAWYQRRGYRRTGILKPFPYGDERFGIPLRDDLRFEVLEKPLAGAAA